MPPSPAARPRRRRPAPRARRSARAPPRAGLRRRPAARCQQWGHASFSTSAAFQGFQFVMQRVAGSARGRKSDARQRRDPHLAHRAAARRRDGSPARSPGSRAGMRATRPTTSQRIVQPRRRAEIDPHRPHREHQVVFAAQQFLARARARASIRCARVRGTPGTARGRPRHRRRYLPSTPVSAN